MQLTQLCIHVFVCVCVYVYACIVIWLFTMIIIVLDSGLQFCLHTDCLIPLLSSMIVVPEGIRP